MSDKIDKAKEELDLYDKIIKKYNLVGLSDSLKELDDEYIKEYMKADKLSDELSGKIKSKYKNGQDVSNIVKSILKVSIIYKKEGIAIEKKMKDALNEVSANLK